MEYKFFQMIASAGHAVGYKIGPIFKHIIDFVQLYFNNCFIHEYCPLKRQSGLSA